MTTIIRLGIEPLLFR